jgi:hypothetical protein
MTQGNAMNRQGWLRYLEKQNGTGLATLHHVHADDLASDNREAALGESFFSAIAPYAMTLVGCRNAVAVAPGNVL